MANSRKNGAQRQREAIAILHAGHYPMAGGLRMDIAAAPVQCIAGTRAMVLKALDSLVGGDDEPTNRGGSARLNTIRAEISGSAAG